MAAMDYSRVAQFYDTYVKTDFDVSFFLQQARGASQVLELMSGTGRLSLPLIEAGVNLTCVDNCPEMLALLQAKLTEKRLSARVHEMDVCDLTLTGVFDLVIIPFHSFAEILDRDEQCKALAGIRRLLSETGRFICTLHNPPIRLRSINGQLTQRGKHRLPDGKGTLFLSAIQHYDAVCHLVRGTQFYEVYDTNGIMCSKSFLDVQFYLYEKDAFQELVESQGFEVLNLYGDYSYGPFQANESPFMIWVLGNKDAPNTFVERKQDAL
jgi:SAM-dependent methyltransferase